MNYKEARELVLQPGKGRFQLLDQILLPNEIMGESVSVLLHRVCSRLTINKEEVSYIGFYSWVRTYRAKQRAKAENKQLPAGDTSSVASETQAAISSGFNFSDPSKIKNNHTQSADIKFL